MPRNTRNSRDSEVAAATSTDVAAGAEAPPEAHPDAADEAPRRSRRSGAARVSFEEEQADAAAARAPRKTPKGPRGKQAQSKKMDPQICKQLEAMARKEQKDLKLIQKKREDLERLKKQRAEEQAKLTADRVAAIEEREVQKQRQKQELLLIKEAARKRKLQLRKEANTRKEQDRIQKIRANKRSKELNNTATKERRL